MAITIFIVDDHPVFRTGLRTVIQADRALSLVGESGEASEALTAIQRLSPQVVIADIELHHGADVPGALTLPLARMSPA